MLFALVRAHFALLVILSSLRSSTSIDFISVNLCPSETMENKEDESLFT